MKKRNRYKRNPYKFHKRVLESKRNVSKKIVQGIGSKLRRSFGRYRRLMEADCLEQLTQLRLTNERENALKDLYSYRLKAFSELRIELTTDEAGKISNLCPYCLLEIAGTLDHIIPQTSFPEYSTHPFNLIPCCSTCNSKKSDDWKENGNRSIIDFYVDDIPAIQFLHVNLTLNNRKLDITYSISFPPNYDPLLQKRLEHHFAKLDLLNRYRENSDDKVDELVSEIKVVSGCCGDDIIRNIISKQAHDMQQKYGVNYWVSILNIACVSDTDVYNYLKNR